MVFCGTVEIEIGGKSWFCWGTRSWNPTDAGNLGKFKGKFEVKEGCLDVSDVSKIFSLGILVLGDIMGVKGSKKGIGLDDAV